MLSLEGAGRRLIYAWTEDYRPVEEKVRTPEAAATDELIAAIINAQSTAASERVVSGQTISGYRNDRFDISLPQDPNVPLSLNYQDVVDSEGETFEGTVSVTFAPDPIAEFTPPNSGGPIYLYTDVEYLNALTQEIVNSGPFVAYAAPEQAAHTDNVVYLPQAA